MMETSSVKERGEERGRVIEIGERYSSKPMCPSEAVARQEGKCICVCVFLERRKRKGHMLWLFQCESKIDSRGRSALGVLPGCAHRHILALHNLWQVLICDRFRGNIFVLGLCTVIRSASKCPFVWTCGLDPFNLWGDKKKHRGTAGLRH